MEDTKFFVDIHDDEHPKYLQGFIRSLNLDFEQLYDITFIFIKNNEEIIKNYPQKIKLFIDKNSEDDNCCYFRIEKIHEFLKYLDMIDNEFFVCININKQLLRIDKTIKYI